MHLAAQNSCKAWEMRNWRLANELTVMPSPSLSAVLVRMSAFRPKQTFNSAYLLLRKSSDPHCESEGKRDSDDSEPVE